MAQAARFLFDLDFSAPPEPEIVEEIEEIPPEPMITVAEHERLLADAIAKARAEGEEKVRQDRDLQATEESTRLEKAILDEISMIYTEVGLLLERLERDASNLAFAFASRFAERLVAQEPKEEIFALLSQIMAPLRKTPHITIRVNEAVADDVRIAVEGQMGELGFQGTLKILPDPAIMPGDCEVEWADGGIGRNLRSAIRQVEQLLDDHFAHLPQEQEGPEDQEDPEEQQKSQDHEASQGEEALDLEGDSPATADQTDTIAPADQDKDKDKEEAQPSLQTALAETASETDTDTNLDTGTDTMTEGQVAEPQSGPTDSRTIQDAAAQTRQTSPLDGPSQDTPGARIEGERTPAASEGEHE